jgi:uncharacterized membrane protein
MGEEGFIILICTLLVTGLIGSPIASLVLLIGIRRRQLKHGEEIDALKQALKQPAEEHASQPEPTTAQTTPYVVPIESRAPATPPPPPPIPVKPPGQQATPTPAPTPKTEWTPLPPAPTSERQPNRFEQAAKQTLSSIWNWIIVSKEYRRPGMTSEQAIAINWLIRIGVPIMVTGILFFLKYSSDHGWLNAQAKVTLTLLTGAALLGTGIRLLGKRYDLIAQGLMGAGLAALYGAVFAASPMYNLITPLVAFGLMICITIGAGFMSVRFNSLLMAILGIIGGYGTPVMLSTESGNLIALYSYMLLLGIGVLGIARYRGWHLLNAMAFAATWGLVHTSLDRYYTNAQFWHIIPFLAAFFILFSTITFIHQLLEGIAASILELCLLMLNAAIFFAIGYRLIANAYESYWAAGLTLSLGAFYTGHLYLFMSRKRRDRNLALGFIALAAFFLIITLPLLLSDQWLTLSWSLQAFVLLWLAAKLESRFLRYVAYILYIIVGLRFFFVDLGAEFAHPVPEFTSLGSYALILLERLISFGVPIASIALAMKLHTSPATAARLKLGENNDMNEIVPPRTAMIAIVAVLCSMLFLYLHLELNRTFMFLWDPIRLPILTLLWIGAAILALTLYTTYTIQALLIIFAMFTVGMLTKLAIVDLRAWDITLSRYCFACTHYSFLDAGMRTLDFALILGFLLYAFGLLRKRGLEQSPHLIFGYGSLALTLFYLTFELNTFLGHFVPGLQAGGISLLWALYALGLLLGGILRGVRPLRIIGLIIFLIAATKVVAFDLRSLDQLYRIVAFILLGIVLLAGAYLYITFESRLVRTRDEQAQP